MSSNYTLTNLYPRNTDIDASLSQLSHRSEMTAEEKKQENLRKREAAKRREAELKAQGIYPDKAKTKSDNFFRYPERYGEGISLALYRSITRDLGRQISTMQLHAGRRNERIEAEHIAMDTHK